MEQGKKISWILRSFSHSVDSFYFSSKHSGSNEPEGLAEFGLQNYSREDQLFSDI